MRSRPRRSPAYMVAYIYLLGYIFISSPNVDFAHPGCQHFVLFPVIRIETTIQKCDTDLLNSIPIVGRVWRYQSGNTFLIYQGRIQDFKLGGGHLKKLRQAEGGAKIFGVFRVKNHDFTPKILIFPILGGARAGCDPPPLDPPLYMYFLCWHAKSFRMENILLFS